MTQDLYCIRHEQMVVPEGENFDGHEFIFRDTDDLPELQFCEFPDGFASCPPPEMEEDWIEHVVEPIEDSLI